MLQALKNSHSRAAAAGAAMLGLALSCGLAGPAAAASSGHVFSNGGGAEGWYFSGSERVWACDLKSDGYSALTQIFSRDDRLLVSVRDTKNNGLCSWKKTDLWSGTHKIRACLVKGSQKPTKCGAKKEWYVD
ncbi:hypothetical protein [Streptomyces sp. NPDC029554]|uniref:hypothetical protein n=1 Tax=Streptomyces sp. NPDC029554 TaxID=3155126 RepID=UPI0033C13290